MLSERSHTQKQSTHWRFHLHKTPEDKRDSQRQKAEGWVLGAGGTGSESSMGAEPGFGKTKKFRQTDGGDVVQRCDCTESR